MIVLCRARRSSHSGYSNYQRRAALGKLHLRHGGAARGLVQERLCHSEQHRHWCVSHLRICSRSHAPGLSVTVTLVKDESRCMPSKGLSNGAIAGIAVGVIIGGLLLIALCIYSLFCIMFPSNMAHWCVEGRSDIRANCWSDSAKWQHKRMGRVLCVYRRHLLQSACTVNIMWCYIILQQPCKVCSTVVRVSVPVAPN